MKFLIYASLFICIFKRRNVVAEKLKIKGNKIILPCNLGNYLEFKTKENKIVISMDFW